ncbi:hypothetical protein MBLNU230_g8545t1 [Neophaeotheca triangularis]
MSTHPPSDSNGSTPDHRESRMFYVGFDMTTPPTTTQDQADWNKLIFDVQKDFLDDLAGVSKQGYYEFQVGLVGELDGQPNLPRNGADS